MSGATTSHKGSRSKSGCKTCRARKIRCDERPGICLNCEKLGLPCSGPVIPPSKSSQATAESTNTLVSPGLKRKRTFRSCAACRATKTRCSGDRPICVRCREKSLQCVYEDSSEPAWRQQLRLSVGQQSPSSNGEREDPDLVPEQYSSDHSISGRQDEASLFNGTSQNHGRWLWSAHLPGDERVRVLVEHYFVNIHPLRCFGFLHKPSFMQRLDATNTSNHEDDALLLMVCSLGALFYAVEMKTTESHKTVRDAGSKWAKRAQQLILAHLGDISVENLMAATLLHEYELRMANFGNAFMLSGMTARMAQALQINLEHSSDILCQKPEPGPSTKESRRRLMWCCYVADSLIGNGVDQLTLIKEADIKIQLPCTERNFLLQSPCITEVLEPGQFLKFITPESFPSYPRDNMGIRAYYLRWISIRRTALKYIKHLDVAKMPWLPDSEFAQITAESRAWYDSLPDSLKWTPSAIYIRKETSQLGALCAMHWMYHQNMCDLFRIGAPALYKLRNPFKFPPEQTGFLTYLQDELFGHAHRIGNIAAEAFRHGPHALADSWACTVVYECSRIMLFHLTQILDPNAERTKALMIETIPLIQSNVKILKSMQSMYAVAELLSNAAEKMLQKVGIGLDIAFTGQSIIPDEPYPANETDENERSQPGTPVQSAPDYVLNPLSIYRMARKTITDKHAPEKERNASSVTGSSPRINLQRRATLQHVSYEPDGVVPEPSAINSYGTDPGGLDDLLSMFTSNPSGWTWHPSETAMGSQMESSGLPPWESTYTDQLDAWMPVFSPGQQFGY